MARRSTARRKAAGDGGRAALDRAVDAALELARTQGWRDTTPGDIAAAAGLSTADLHREVGGKAEILLALARRADAAMLDGEPPEGDSVRDRLFDLLMRRLDALSPSKAGLKAVARDLPREPMTALLLGCATLRGMGRALEAAGVARGPLAPLRAKALAAIYLATLRTWLGEDDTDNSKAMAALDKALRRAESIAQPLARAAKSRKKPS